MFLLCLQDHFYLPVLWPFFMAVCLMLLADHDQNGDHEAASGKNEFSLQPAVADRFDGFGAAEKIVEKLIELVHENLRARSCLTRVCCCPLPSRSAQESRGSSIQ